MSSTYSVPTTRLGERWLQRTSNFFTFSWYFLVIAVIAWGWLNRDNGYLVAESGLGYLLGITGGVLMLLLLVYSLRKRWRFLRRVFSVKFWFRFHMALGILGPLAILFHCNFRLASLNSTVALICMLLVAGSGIIGRYLYTRIHYGLYGEKIKLKDVLKDFREIEADILTLAVLEKQQVMAKKIFAAIHKLLEQQNHPMGMLATYRSVSRAKKIAKGLRKLTWHLADFHQRRATHGAHIEDLQIKLSTDSEVLLSALKKLPGLQMSERLFSLWHVIHIPIFILMIISVVVHVFVVHMY